MTLVVLGVAWLLAMAAVALWGAPGWMVAAWLAAATPAVALRWGRNGALLCGAAAVLALVAGLRFEGWQDRPPPDLAHYVGQTATLEGVVASEPDPGQTTTKYCVDVKHIRRGQPWAATDGAVLVYAGQYADYPPGTPVRLTGELEEPPVFPDFDYRGYLARQGIVATMLRPRIETTGEAPRRDRERLLADLRLRLQASLERALPEPEASLGAGIAFGRDGNLPDDLYDDFRTTGLAHIVAVSGSNVTLVTAVVFLVLTPLVGVRWATWPAAASVVAYLFVAGLSASVVRAGIMAVVYLAGARLGRQQSSLAALGAAAIAMTAVQPEAAQDLGFQLSLAATAGLIVFGPWVRFGLRWAAARARLDGPVVDMIAGVSALSLSATVATLPIAWVNFGQVSLSGPLANVVVEPVFVLAFLLSALTAVAGLAWDPAGWAAGLAAYYPLAFITWVARHAANLPLASVSVPRAGGTAALVAYVVMGIAGWPAYRFLAPETHPSTRSGPSRVRRLALPASSGAFAVAVVWVSLLPLGGPGELEVTVLDIGQGDAILVTTPHGRQLLVDSGPSGIELARELGAVLPHWDRSLDRVLVTHPQEDHVAGMAAILDRFGVGEEIDTGIVGSIESYRAYRERANHRRELHAGASWTDDGVLFEVLWRPADYSTKELNDTSLVLRITYGETRLLLTGDFESPAQAALMAREDVRSDVLKVPHHGSKTSASEFFEAVRPSVAIISVGVGNPYGHPAPDILQALDGSTILRTDRDGRITVSSNGKRLRVRTEH